MSECEHKGWEQLFHKSCKDCNKTPTEIQLEEDNKLAHAMIHWKTIEVDKLRVENRQLKSMIDNGLGWEDVEQDSMQSHIN